MDVTPMSLQIMVPRAADATQVQHNLNQANAMQADYQAVQQKEADKLKQAQVQAKENPEDGRIQEDPDRQQKQGREEKGMRQKNSTEEKDSEQDPVRYAQDPSRGHLLDISL